MPTIYEYAKYDIKDLEDIYRKTRAKFQQQIRELYKQSPEKQLENFQKGGYKYAPSVTELRKNKYRQTLTGKEQRQDLAVRLAELEQYANMPTLSLSGRKRIKRQTIKTLRSQGLTWLNNKTFPAFGEFMGWAKSTGLFDAYGSNQVRTAYDELMSGGTIDGDELKEIIVEWMQSYGLDTSDFYDE